MSTFPEKETVSFIISIAGALTAISSLVLSYFNFRRDNGRLDVYIGIGSIHGGTPLQHEQDVLHIKVVNAGRRPVIMTSLGGDNPRQSLKRFLWPLFPSVSWLSPRAFLISGGIYIPALLNMPDGSSKVLHEGQSSQVVIPLPQALDLAKQLANGSSVYIFDSIGNRHKVKKTILRKLRSDVADLVTRYEGS